MRFHETKRKKVKKKFYSFDVHEIFSLGHAHGERRGAVKKGPLKVINSHISTLCKINVCQANGSANAGYHRAKEEEAKPNFKKISNRFMCYFGYFSPMLKIGSAKTTDVRANPSHCNRSFRSLPCARISPHTLSAPAFFSVKVTLYESKVL